MVATACGQELESGLQVQLYMAKLDSVCQVGGSLGGSEPCNEARSVLHAKHSAPSMPVSAVSGKPAIVAASRRRAVLLGRKEAGPPCLSNRSSRHCTEGVVLLPLSSACY